MMSDPFVRFGTALQEAGWTISVESSTTRQPRLVTVTRGNVIHALRVYIWKVTRGGPSTVRPSEEYRIQKMTRGPLELVSGRLTLLLGWYEADDIFVAWDAAAHVNASYSASIQVRAPYIEEAQRNGMAVQHRDEPAEEVVIVHGNLISDYIEELAPIIHGRQLTGVDVTFPNLDTRYITDAEGDMAERVLRRDTGQVPIVRRPEERRRATIEVTRWVRNTAFREAVTWAYNYRCSTCEIGLKLVEAAHIIPVANPASTNYPSNGLALCPLHHDAYDDGIYGVTEQFRIVLNDSKIADLNRQGRADGLDVFLRITPVGESIKLPDHAPYQPDPILLSQALILRGFR